MNRFYLLILSLLLIASCHKESDTIIKEEDHPTPPEVKITTRLVSVKDTTSALTGTTWQTFAGETASFGDFPYLIGRGQQISRDHELTTVTIEGLRFFQTTALVENDVNYLHWSVPEIISSSANTNTDQNIDIGALGTLHIPAHSLLSENGDPYEGGYAVSFADLMSKENSFPTYTSISNAGVDEQLIPELGFYVGVVSDLQQPLLFSPGVTFSVQQPVSSAWQFNTAVRRWKEIEKSGQLTIEQPGYYATGLIRKQTRLSGTLNLNGKRLSHQLISINYDDITREIFTTNAGKWAVLIPAETQVLLSVQLPCGEERSFDISTGTDAEMSVDLNAASSAIVNAVIKGTVKDCQATPTEASIMLIENPEAQFYYVPAGDIAINVPVCSGMQVGVKALDLDTEEAGPEIKWNGQDTIDIHSAFACAQASGEYLLLNVAGDQKMYWDMTSALTPQTRVLIKTGAGEPDADFELFITGMNTGEYEDTKLNIFFEDMHLGAKGFYLNCPTAMSGCGFTEFTMTHFPSESGKWIRGYFRGKFWMKSFTPLTAAYRDVEGEFQVYREF